MKYILNDAIKDCRNKRFGSFEKRCVYDIKLTKMEKNEKVVSTIVNRYMKFDSQIYAINKKLKSALENGFRFNEIVKLTIKFDSSISIINRCFYSKRPIPIMPRQFLRIISQNPDYVKCL